MTDTNMVSPLETELTERAASYRNGGPSSEHTAELLDRAAERIADLERALKRIDCLDEAGGHELKERHAFEAVNIARAALRAKEP